jgi:hypothetical protein
MNNFAQLIDEIAEAEANGRKYGFRALSPDESVEHYERELMKFIYESPRAQQIMKNDVA